MSDLSPIINFKLNKVIIIRILVLLIALLLIGHCFSVYFLVEDPSVLRKGGLNQKIIQFFNFDTEANLPTFFSSLLLLFNGLLLAFIGFAEKQKNLKYLPWIGLSIIFIFLSLDEIITIHEHLVSISRGFFNASGYFHFAWVIPYGIIFLVLGVVYVKFLLRLPKQILILFIVAAVVFVSGAIGMELISGKQVSMHGKSNLNYHLMYTLEELLEMVGSTIFCFALMSYICLSYKSVLLEFKHQKQ